MRRERNADARRALDAAMLEAHTRADPAALIALYAAAADAATEDGDFDAACFYRTHALVFALEVGDARADALRAPLVAAGRDA